MLPGGDVLLTQFWDTAPSTGPSDSWTIHGLWPDNCDGSYEQYCDQNRQYTNISAILQEKASCTLKTMQTYWKDYNGEDETFWEHEFGKHGTCMSTLNPECYDNYQPTDEVADFFTRAVSLFKTLPTYDWLAAAGIVPSSTQTYTLAAIQEVLTAHHGHNAGVDPERHVQGRGPRRLGLDLSRHGDQVPAQVRHPGHNDGNNGIPAQHGHVVPTGTPGALAGKGYVKVQPDGFMISTGNWYRASGTPATYTATPNGDAETFALKTSKGPCQVLAGGSLSCAADLAASDFGYDGTYITYNGAATFYAASAPSGQDKGVVFTTEQAVSLQMYWQPL
ncbi:hypothetical protein EKO27_g4911 [Xylaria grammica]|uniref:Ribonuclease T2-like n=1 Tax=Xylaria grammica TaxID=363999 RepID=A0A439D724_9PEZI|nr:hypothetical protein EKO27_g4911 [Xylaria grammica]